MLHEDRRRGDAFGANAENYDKSRPSYPPELIDDLVATGPLTVLDVGCGTGIASRLFSDRGCDVLGIEPDERMADVARRLGSTVEISTFEDFDPKGRSFDLLVSGQAWHWVDPWLGAKKAVQAVSKKGRIALFWNVPRHEPPMKAALGRAYARVAPDVEKRAIASTIDGRIALATDGIDATNELAPVEKRIYNWQTTFSKEQWLTKLVTHSDHQVLPVAQLAALLGEIGAAIDGNGGSLTLRYEATLLTTTKRTGPSG